ncbi:hypothetical protein IWQ61_005926 [Dispira simplex]|nr:hypothetical protein IWQ61_005926 [Dispira simplex]
MSDAKYFQRGKLQELRAELLSEKRDPKHTKKKTTLKKVVANMTMGSDMAPLCSEVIACMTIPSLEVKRMVYLYLVNYGRSRPEIANLALQHMLKDADDHNPLVRAQAIRTMSYLYVERVIDALCDPLRYSLKDKDPYVRKTAALCVVKLCMYDRTLVEEEQFIDMLKSLLSDANPAVVANAVAALTEISECSQRIKLRLNLKVASKLIQALNQCSEWGQVYILEALMLVIPQEEGDAEMLAERIIPRLQHANSAVILAAIKLIVYLLNYMPNPDTVHSFCHKLTPPLITLLNSRPEVQYVTLRNIQLIIQRRPEVLKHQLKAFFCKYNDPIYVKLAKLEILIRLTTPKNVHVVLLEFQEYAAEVDVDFVRKAVRCIGRLAIKIEQGADQCIEVLLRLIQTKVNYVVQEAVVVIKDIFRKYPNRYESIIGTLCENLDSLDDAEAKSAMIWVIGEYADRIDNADDVLDGFLDDFLEESTDVQLALLTATVKLFIKRPTLGQELVPKVLKWATEEVDNPDLRDRGYIYWRLLSTDPAAAKEIILSQKPDISAEAENLDPLLLEELLMNISSLATIYHRPPASFIPGAKRRFLPNSKVLQSQRVLPPGMEINLEDASPSSSIVDDSSNQVPVVKEETSSTSDSSFDPLSLGPSDTTTAMPNPYTLDESAPTTNIMSRGHMAMSSHLADLLDLDFNDTIPHPTSGETPPSVEAVGIDSTTGGMAGFTMNYGDGQSHGTYAQLESDFLQGTGETKELHPTVGENPFGADALLHGIEQPAVETRSAFRNAFSGATSVEPTPSPPAIRKAFTNTFNPTEGGLTTDLANSLQALNMSPAASPVMSSNMITAVQPTQPESPTESYVAKKSVLLSAQSAKGLEVQGTFGRRQGQLFLDLTFGNFSGQPVGNFALQFNKNSYGLWPATQLAVPTLEPQTSFETTLPLTTTGPVQTMTPVNNLQVALKSSLGIFYFQMLFLLHILFQEDARLEQNDFLSAWKEIPDAMQKLTTVYSLNYTSMLQVRQKLHRNNIFTVAERVVDGMTHFYASAKTLDGSVFLSELKVDPSFQVCYCATKTFATALLNAYQTAVEALLVSGAHC